MKIALLGYGKEGRAAYDYFNRQGASFDVFENLTPTEFASKDYSSYDIIIRSPSVPPFDNPRLTSLTRFFMEHCPCPIIGVTATKGKGTTCSFIKALLDADGKDAYLVGNIGTPAIEVLDSLTASSVVVYEMSSFQLWDLSISPHIAVIGQLEPDHLNVHRDYADYLRAKSNICRHQTPNDYCVFYHNNPESVKLASTSPAQHVPYPFTVPADILRAISLPGKHNQYNAMAAIASVACYKNISPSEYLSRYSSTIRQSLSTFHGLPHRLEFLRELNGVRYFDDNFSTTASSTRVAVNAFPDSPLVVIVGGRDKTSYQDLTEIYEILSNSNIKSVILLGELGHELARTHHDPRFLLTSSLADAVANARKIAETLTRQTSTNTSSEQTAAKSPAKQAPIVLMSPAAASFDMFKDVYDRGAQFQALVSDLR